MLVLKHVEQAVRLQTRGYLLLRWLEKALNDGFIAPEAAGVYGTSEDAAYAWLDKHYLNLPDDARPERSELRAFSNLFTTFLGNTFELDADPGEYLYSPEAHCFCPICSWMVRKPHIRPRKVGAGDKVVAERMKRGFLLRLAAARSVSVPEATVDEMLTAHELRDPLGLCTYAADLLQRLEGRTAAGAASLALWRSFAWTPQGSPKKGFVLSADDIMAAQEVLAGRMSAGEGSR